MMRRLTGALNLVAALVALGGCAHARDARIPPVLTTPGSRMVRIGSGVELEIVDWGGRGPPLVFLAGLGNTAHVFDAFAPQFTDHFHVVGITRRGFGASAGAPPPTDLDTLVADVAAALDSIGLARVVLVGHSIAGEEMTRFAEMHATRCAGLVYLDAAYDRTNIDSLAAKQPSAPSPPIDPADTTSFVRLRALYARVMGVDEPESEIRATERFDAADRYLGPVTPNYLKARIASGKRTAHYDAAHCRALAVYADAESVGDVVPYYKTLNAAGRVQAESLFRFVQAVVSDSRTRVARLPEYQIADVHGSNHYVFLQHSRQVATAMRAFLADSTRVTPAAVHATSDSTFVVFLGTGTPRPDPTAMGPATAIVVGSRTFLFDAGVGVTRRFTSAKIALPSIAGVFFTHLHSDHTLGYPDLIFTTWTMGRRAPLQVYGPHGLAAVTDAIYTAWHDDIDIRTNGLEHLPANGYRVNVHEIAPGVVFDSGGIRITAIPVLHGSWKEAYGYRIDTPDRSIVISGDTRSAASIEQAARGVDVLIHEVHPESAETAAASGGRGEWPRYLREFHTSDVALGKLAAAAHPKTLILYHFGAHGTADDEVIATIRAQGYTGRIVVAKDLDRF